MGTFNIYDSVSGSSYAVTIDVTSNVFADGVNQGEQRYYVTISTTVKDYKGASILPKVIADVDFDDNLTSVIKAHIVELFEDITGSNVPGYPFSSSSSESSSFSISSGKSSESMSSRLGGTSSSVSSETSSRSQSSVSP